MDSFQGIFYFFFLQGEPIALGGDVFACPYCNKTMKDKSNMKRHVKIHTGEKPFKCPFCPFAAVQKKSIVSHALTKHQQMI